MIREGLSYNQLEWACWNDQISTVIVFEDTKRIYDTQMTIGTIFMSVYRKHETKDREFIRKFKEIVLMITRRYEKPKIFIGGDWNLQS